MFKWLGCGEKTWEVQEIHIWVCAHPFLFAELDMIEHVHRHLMVQNAQSVSSVTQSCPTLCDPMDVPVHHQLLELIQTHVH